MLLKLLNTVAMFTVITSSIHGRQNKTSEVDYPMDSLPSNTVTQRPFHILPTFSSKVAELEVDYPMDSLSSKVKQRPFHILPNLSSKVAELPFSLPNKFVEVDYPMGSLPSKKTERPFQHPPNFSSKVEELPFSLPNKLDEVDYPMGSLPSKKTEMPFQHPPNFSSKVEELPFSLPNKLDEVNYPMGSLPSKNTERYFQHLPNFSSKVEELPFSLPNKLVEVEYPMGSLPSKNTERPFQHLPNFSSKVAELPFSVPNKLVELDYPMDSLPSKETERPFQHLPNFSRKVAELPFSLPNKLVEVDYPMGSLPSMETERPFQYPHNISSMVAEMPFSLPNLTTKMANVPYYVQVLPILTVKEGRMDESEIQDEIHALNPTSSSPSSSDDSMMRAKSDESMMKTMSDELMMKTMADESMMKTMSDELMMKTMTDESMMKTMSNEAMVEMDSNSLAYLNLQGHTGGYGSDNIDKNINKYCIWYDAEKEKEYQFQTGTEWSGNGCKSHACKNGVIIPDPTCCKVETHLNGYTSTYYLYKNHGEKWIKACELLTCDSGLITKEKRIPGCCVYDHTGSKADGETWWAYSAGSGNNFCKVGRCNNGIIEVIQIEEGGAWRNGCFDHICKDSDFVINIVNLPGSCNINHSGYGCIVNGTIEKIWSKCQGVFCINGNLFKGELKYCSEKALLLYNRYNI